MLSRRFSLTIGELGLFLSQNKNFTLDSLKLDSIPPVISRNICVGYGVSKQLSSWVFGVFSPPVFIHFLCTCAMTDIRSIMSQCVRKDLTSVWTYADLVGTVVFSRLYDKDHPEPWMTTLSGHEYLSDRHKTEVFTDKGDIRHWQWRCFGRYPREWCIYSLEKRPETVWW